MMQRLVKTVLLIVAVLCALCFSKVLMAATSTGSLAVSAVVLSHCVIRFSRTAMAAQSTCDDGMKAITTIEPYSQNTRLTPSKRSTGPSETGTIITLTY